MIIRILQAAEVELNWTELWRWVKNLSYKYKLTSYKAVLWEQLLW